MSNCEHCGGDKVFKFSHGCPGCGAPVCCQTCCDDENTQRAAPAAPAAEPTEEMPTWVILHRPGKVPQRKGPFLHKKLVESMLRELYQLYPDCICDVLDMPGECYPESGREWLAMYGDKRRKPIPPALAAPSQPAEPVAQAAQQPDLRFIQRVLESDAPKQDRDAAARMVRELRRKVMQPSHPAAEQAAAEGERERMRLAGISTAALGYWKEGDSIHPDYDTPALRDVARLYAEYEAARRPVRELTDADLIDRIKEALPEFSQSDDFLLAHGASVMSEDSHEIIHVDTAVRIARALLSKATGEGKS